jgi:hypothetical protein
MANPGKGNIKAAEDEVEHHHIAPVIPPARNAANMGMMVKPNTQNLRMMPASVPALTATTTLLLTNELYKQIRKWPAPNQQPLKQDISLQLLTLQKILNDETVEETIEEGKFAIPRVLTDPTSPGAPSLGKLQSELQAIQEPISSELSEAIKDFTEKLVCLSPEPTPPAPKKQPHRDLDSAAPQPQGD